MGLHRTLPYTENHRLQSLEFADAAARDAVSGLAPNDIGRIARQVDNNSFWLLTDDDPVVWQGFSGVDYIQVNGVDVVNANFNIDVPAAPVSGINICWQTSGSDPADISAYVPEANGITLGVIKLQGQLGGVADSPDVRGLRETGGPTLLAMGGVADGELLIRLGDTISGVDPALPGPHASTHQHGGVDEVATSTPGANAIPKANASGQLNAGWIDDVSHGTRSGGSLHALVTTSIAGFMSASDKSTLDTVSGMHEDMSEPTGFVDASDSQISFTDGTRTLSIQPTGANYSFWTEGTRYTKTGTDSKQITDTEGLHFFYFDISGVLQSTQSFTSDILLTYAIVAAVYWDATNNTAIYFGDERHGIVMDGETHRYLHETFGARWISGLVLGDMIVDGSGDVDSHAQFSVADGDIRDEDIEIAIVDGSPQDLDPIAQIPIFYRSGASGDWRKKTADNFPVIYSGTAGYGGTLLPWNEWTGSTWQLTEVTSGDYVLMHYFATNDVNTPIIGIQGQVEYGSIISARAGAEVELNSLFISGLPVLEFVPIATVIYQTANGYSNTPQARVRSVNASQDYVDWRGSGFTPGSGVSADVLPHAGTHQHGGTDEVATATSAANAIPKADGTGKLSRGWLPSREVCFTVETNAAYNSRRVRTLTSVADYEFNGAFPGDFNSIVKMVIRGFISSGAAGSGKDIDMSVELAGEGQVYNNRTASDTTTVYDLTGYTDSLYEFDISGLFSAAVAGDHFGLLVDHNTIGGSIYYVDIVLEYV
jgi:hypothetical protein